MKRDGGSHEPLPCLLCRGTDSPRPRGRGCPFGGIRIMPRKRSRQNTDEVNSEQATQGTPRREHKPDNPYWALIKFAPEIERNKSARSAVDLTGERTAPAQLP